MNGSVVRVRIFRRRDADHPIHDAFAEIPMGHEDHRPVAQFALKQGEHLLFTLPIQRGGGFVQHQHPGLFPEHPEWEKSIPRQDAEELLLLCHCGVIDKTRHIVPASGSQRYFEVDEFHGDNEGLTMAEIELGSPDEAIERPDWLGEEVTGDHRYYNSYLTKVPFKQW